MFKTIFLYIMIQSKTICPFLLKNLFVCVPRASCGKTFHSISITEQLLAIILAYSMLNSFKPFLSVFKLFCELSYLCVHKDCGTICYSMTNPKYITVICHLTSRALTEVQIHLYNRRKDHLGHILCDIGHKKSYH